MCAPTAPRVDCHKLEFLASPAKQRRLRHVTSYRAQLLLFSSCWLSRTSFHLAARQRSPIISVSSCALLKVPTRTSGNAVQLHTGMHFIETHRQNGCELFQPRYMLLYDYLISKMPYSCMVLVVISLCKFPKVGHSFLPF